MSHFTTLPYPSLKSVFIFDARFSRSQFIPEYVDRTGSRSIPIVIKLVCQKLFPVNQKMNYDGGKLKCKPDRADPVPAEMLKAQRSQE